MTLWLLLSLCKYSQYLCFSWKWIFPYFPQTNRCRHKKQQQNFSLFFKTCPGSNPGLAVHAPNQKRTTVQRRWMKLHRRPRKQILQRVKIPSGDVYALSVTQSVQGMEEKKEWKAASLSFWLRKQLKLYYWGLNWHLATFLEIWEVSAVLLAQQWRMEMEAYILGRYRDY